MLTLKEQSLDWALSHALEYGDTDVFPIPFEYEAIKHDWSEIKNKLLATDIMDWNVRPHRFLLSPKGKYSFRVVTQLDPIDFIIYTASIFEIAQDIESRRIPTSANRVFSYRFNPDKNGRLFDDNIGYRDFLNTCKLKSEELKTTGFIATADISDFYSRIYHHRLENALRSSTSKTSHVKSIMHLLSAWNRTETYGIPVGCASSRLLAEIAISDVDEALLAYGFDFIRFNDDYRFFCKTKKDAFKQIAMLAELLNTNHGLSLQPQKTNIYTTVEFQKAHLTTPLDREIKSLQGKFEEIAESIGLSSWYEPIDYQNLTEEQQKLIDTLNIVELFKEEASKTEPDLPVLRFCLRRLGQLGDDSIVDDIFNHIDNIIAVFVDCLKYFECLRFLKPLNKSQLGSRLLDLLNDSIVSSLTYHRLWILNLFTHSTEWDNEGRFLSIYNSTQDQPCKREIILALGRSRQQHWFQTQWRSLFEHPHWQRRALLAAASCMPQDARKHWYKSIEPNLDILELAVIRWAKQYPF